MNADAPPTNDSDSSASPAASGSSDLHEEGSSSAETTPPPHAEGSYRDSKRFSTNSSTFSRSYQSVFSSSSVPNNDNATFGHHRHWSTASSNRPVTANTSIADSYRDEDPADLAAAVGLLSCSYGTPKSGPTGMASDVPPVPPLPAKYAQEQVIYHDSPHQDDVEMGDEEMDSDDEVEEQHPNRIDEVDEGIFGKMD